MEAINIIIGVFLILLGIVIKHGKMYNWIAGYNTKSPEEKKNVDIEGFSTLMRNCFLIMGMLIIAGHYFLGYMELFNLIPFVILIVVSFGLTVLLFLGEKYKKK